MRITNLPKTIILAKFLILVFKFSNKYGFNADSAKSEL